ncbi:MAG: AbrB/MazE/SpoVT family DNA-binding domain-containing protein [Dehalococcoidia bacterium]
MGSSVRTKIGAGGRVVIPAEFRAKLGLHEGDQVIISCDDGEIRLSTYRERVKRIQAFVAERIDPAGPSIVDELIRERRAEAARE